MGLPAERLEFTEMYVPRRAFYVIAGNDAAEKEGNDTAERFRDLHRYIQKIASKFWHEIVDDESDPTAKLGLMQSASKHIPSLDITERNFAYSPTADLVDIAHGNAIQSVPDYSEKKDKEGRLPRLGYTYMEVHDMPDVRFAAINALRDDPSIEIVRSLEGWRYSTEPNLHHQQIELGRTAFEAYLFSVGAPKFLPALGKAATSFLK